MSLRTSGSAFSFMLSAQLVCFTKIFKMPCWGNGLGLHNFSGHQVKAAPFRRQGKFCLLNHKSGCINLNKQMQ